MNPRKRRGRKSRRRRNCGAAAPTRPNRRRRSRRRSARRRRNPFALQRSTGHRFRHNRRRRRNPFGFSFSRGLGFLKSLAAGVAGFYGTKATLLAVQKPLDNFITSATWKEPAKNAAAAGAAFGLSAIGRATKLVNDDTAKAVLVGGLLFAVSRGVESYAAKASLTGFTKDLLSGYDDDDLSDFVLADGQDGWDAGLGHIGHQGNVLDCPGLGDFDDDLSDVDDDLSGEDDGIDDYVLEGD